jgi:hypothetical protein
MSSTHQTVNSGSSTPNLVSKVTLTQLKQPNVKALQNACHLLRAELDEVKEALIDLYLDVKVRPQEDVSFRSLAFVALKT